MPNRLRLACLLLPLALFCSIATAQSDLKLASIFGDSMVLQSGMAVPVWGWAGSGQEVTVMFGDQTKKAKADDKGRWQIKLDEMEANAEGQSLRISAANTIELKDILVGEVWICSGQSNMEWSLSNSINGKEEVAASEHPQIRLFNVQGHTTSPLPKDTLQGQWQICGPKSSGGFSAVGYFFGRELQKELKVPIGLVGSNWGGTRIEPWTSPDAFTKIPELKKISDQVAAYNEKTKVTGSSPSAIFNAMIHPLSPFTMRGAIWYQGESNGSEGESYYHKTHALVNGWRELFNPELSFYWVQLADFQKPNDNPAGGDGWAKLRDAQRKALDLKHTGMAVIIDIGEENDIHPRNKQDVGWRLAQWSLNQTYGMKDVVPSGPLYKSHVVEGDAIRISFDNVGGGLMVGKKAGLSPTEEVKDGKLQRFAIAGGDKQWHWADATIDGETVVVKSSKVAEPVAVRYAFTMNPAGANLYNKDGIPASPFRTDHW